MSVGGTGYMHNQQKNENILKKYLQKKKKKKNVQSSDIKTAKDRDRKSWTMNKRES